MPRPPRKSFSLTPLLPFLLPGLQSPDTVFSLSFQDSSLFPSFKMLTWKQDTSLQLESKQGLQTEKSLKSFYMACALKNSTSVVFPLAALHPDKMCALLKSLYACGLLLTSVVLSGEALKLFPHPVWLGTSALAQKPPWSWSRVLAL